MHKVTKEFVLFLKEYKVVSLAVAFVLGSASTSLVNSLVKDIIMPLASPLLVSGSLRDATWRVGSVAVAYGSFLAEFINFIILALVIFIVAKKLLAAEKNK